MSNRSPRAAVAAAADVNDNDVLNTTIQGSEAVSAADQTTVETGNGGRELVWKTAEGAQKRLVLPIETIQEDVMDDPEHLLAKVGVEGASAEERDRIVAALKDVQDSSMTKKKNPIDSALTSNASQFSRNIDSSVAVAPGESSVLSQSAKGLITLTNASSLASSLDTQSAEGQDSNNTSSQLKQGVPQVKATLQKQGTQKAIAQKKRFGKGSKKKSFKRFQSEGLIKKGEEDDDGVIAEQSAEVDSNQSEKEEEANTSQMQDEAAPINPANFFDIVKQRFFEKETQLNTKEQLEQIRKDEEEKQRKDAEEAERKAAEEEDRKMREEEEKRLERRYGPGGRFGQSPALAAIQKALHEQAEARRLKRQKEKEERREQLRQEKLARGEEVKEEDLLLEEEESEEEIDYNVVMQEEEAVPEGEKAQKEQERYLEGRTMRQIVTYPGKLVRLVPDTLLPKKLPDNLVYWNKCETRVDSQRLIKYSQIQNFQQKFLVQFNDEAAKKKVMKEFPLIDDLEMWADPEEKAFANTHEQAIYASRAWPNSFKEYRTEGYIKFERIRPYDCFFNSRFESGNCRQVFKVPQEADFGWIPVDDEVPDYLPEELQEERKQEIATLRANFMKDRTAKLLEQEKEDESEMKKLPHLRDKERVTPLSDFDDDKNDEEKEEAKEGNEKQNLDLNDVVSNDGNEGGDEDKPKKKVRKVKKVKADSKPDCEYNVYLQDDTNADSALFQWYYFSVMNVRQDTTMRLKICNLSKPNGLYAKGMKPFVYSINRNKNEGLGWHRGGENVSYSQNGHTARFSKKTLDAHYIADGSVPVGKDQYKALHTLQFDYRFSSDYDIVFFAHFQPYTYTDLTNFLCTLKADEKLKDRMRIDYICNTLGTAPMYGLTITSNIEKSYTNVGKEVFKFQRAVYRNAVVKPKKVKYVDPVDADKNGDGQNSDPESHDKKSSSDSDKDSLASSKDDSKRNELATDSVALEVQTQAVQLNVGPLSGIDEASPGLKKGAVDLGISQSSLKLASEEQKKAAPGVQVDQVTADDISKLPVSGLQQTQEETALLQPSASKKGSPNKRKVSTMVVSKNQLMNETQQTDYSGRRHKRNNFHFLPKPDDKDPNEGKDEKFYKKHLFITSRVHPGESQASHMVHGVIQFLLSDEPEAQEIRDKFVVKVIPMLNPDGVIHGNYRVSLLGVDLNRRWKKPSKYLHPTVYYTKALIKYFNEKSRQPGADSGGVVLCCDFHGHSRNMDLFMYSCIDEISMNNMIIRSAPVGVDREIPIFNMKSCNFAMEKDKENTARIVLFKEIGILSSYTLESTFYGSEFLKRQKPGAFLLTKEQQEHQAERYGVAHSRKDISFDFDMCLLMGADFMKGINYSSKKKPLLTYWFRQSNPPKNIIELIRPRGQNADPDNDIDPALLELEKAWKPIGAIKQDKYIGIGDRLDPETGEKYDVMPRTPPDEKRKGRKVDNLDVALLDKQRKKKKTDVKKRKAQLAQERKEQLAANGSVSKEYPLNYDMQDIMGEGGSAVKKGKKKKRLNSPGRRVSSPAKRSMSPRKRLSSHFRQHPLSSNITSTKHSKDRVTDVKLQDDDSNATPRSSLQKIPIQLREPGGQANFADEFDSDDDAEEEEANLLMSQDNQSSVQRALKAYGSQKQRHDSTSDEENQQNDYLIGRQLDSVRKSANKTLINSMNVSLEEIATNRDSKQSESSSKRQLNLSVRMKDGKAIFKQTVEGMERLQELSMPRIDSMMEDKDQSEDRIESRLMESKHRSMLQRLTDPSLFDQKGSQLTSDKESRALNALQDVSDLAFQRDQSILQKLEMTKKNLTSQVSAEELDELMRPDIEEAEVQRVAQKSGLNNQEALMMITQAMAQGTFNKNRLSVDPMVFPASRFEALAQINVKTLEKEMTQQYQSIKSPRKSVKRSGSVSPSKLIFAPRNGVYNQTQLLQNPELAKQKGINFTFSNSGAQESLGVQSTQMQAFKKQLNKKIKQTNAIAQNHQKNHKSMAMSPSQVSLGVGFTENSASPGLKKKSSGIFQSRASKGALLQRSTSNQSSLTTIQTAVASGGYLEQGFSINDYVQEQLNLLEKTKVKVKKPRKKPRVINLNEGQSLGIIDHSSTLVLPNIKPGKSGIETQRAEVLAGKKYKNDDLGSVGGHLASETQSVDAKNVLIAIESASQIDSLSIGLPALSPQTMKIHKKPKVCLQMKDGFDFANNVDDRHHEKLVDLKQTQTLRERKRKLSKPQFVIKPLDPREFLAIQMQHVEATDYRPAHEGRARTQNLKMGSALKQQPPRVATQSPTFAPNPALKPFIEQIISPVNLQNQSQLAHQQPQLLSPTRSRRTMSMGQQDAAAKAQSSPPMLQGKQLHPAALTMQAGSAQSQKAKAALRQQIRQREVKSLAVRNVVNQTMVVNNKLLVFKPK